MNEKIIATASDYDRLDGGNAYHSEVKRLTLGAPTLKENQAMQIAAQLWTAQEDGTLKMSAELPIHQVFDLMIVLSRTFWKVMPVPAKHSLRKPCPLILAFPIQK